jgi:hypothetical protein
LFALENLTLLAVFLNEFVVMSIHFTTHVWISNN